MKKILSLALAITMLFAFAIPVSAADEQTIYLKGKGDDFTETWQDVFYLGGAENAEDPSVWHLVYTGEDINYVTAMQLDFGVNKIWNWDSDDGFSKNPGGNNFGWVIVAPHDWEISYVNSGNNNESESYLVTKEAGNINFNISGFHQGTPDGDGGLKTTISIQKFLNEMGNPGEGFEFDVFPADGPYNISLATLVTDSSGVAGFTFDPALEQGDYIVRERLPEGFAPVDDLHFTVDAKGAAEFVDDYNIILNISLGAIEVTDDVVELYHEEFHKPVYKMYKYGTLVSWANTLGGAELPKGITGDNYLGNGMTYLKINKAALEELGEVTIGIAESNKPGKKVSEKWNSPVVGEKSYTLQIVDGKLVVTSDLPGFGAAVYSSAKAINGPKDIKHNDATEYEITTDANGDFWFFFHIGSAEYHLGEIIGCEIDYLSDEVYERDFPGEVTMTIADAEGVILYNDALGLVEDLLAGDYTVTIFADGVQLASDIITVIPGETVNADFGKLTVPELGDPVIICNICNPIILP